MEKGQHLMTRHALVYSTFICCCCDFVVVNATIRHLYICDARTIAYADDELLRTRAKNYFQCSQYFIFLLFI